MIRSDDEIEGVLLGRTDVGIIGEVNTSTTYRVFIDEAIDESVNYQKLISIFNNASPNDTVVLHINSPGGDISIAMMIYNAMKQTQARTVARVDGYAASAATLFLMVADEIEVSEHAWFMFHGASYGVRGAMQGNKEFVEYHHAHLLKYNQSVYEGFFSKEEINSMIEKQKDIYMGCDELIARLQCRKDGVEYIIAKKKKKEKKDV